MGSDPRGPRLEEYRVPRLTIKNIILAALLAAFAGFIVAAYGLRNWVPMA